MRRKAVREPEVKAEAVHGRAMRVQGANPRFAVVKFNEEKRVFDTGNILKVVGPKMVQAAKESMSKDTPWIETFKLEKRVRAKMRKLFLPTAADLDAVAEEERIKWLTQRK